MKAQVLTLAAMALAANVAIAANSTQSTSTASFDSIESLLNKAASASNTSVKASTSTGDKIENLQEALNKEKTMELRKSDMKSSALGSLAAVGAFSVKGIEVSVEGVTKITKMTFEGLQSGSHLVLTKTEPVAQKAAKGVDSSAQATVDEAKDLANATVRGAKIVGRKTVEGAKYVGQKTVAVGTSVYVGLTHSGKVLIDDAAASGKQSMTSGAKVVGSVSRSAQAFGSEVRKGFSK